MKHLCKDRIATCMLIGLLLVVPCFFSYVPLVSAENKLDFPSISADDVRSMLNIQDQSEDDEDIIQSDSVVRMAKVDPQLFDYYKSQIKSNNPIEVFLQTDEGMTANQKIEMINAKFSFVQIKKAYEHLPLVIVLVNPSNLGLLSEDVAVKAIYPNKVMKLQQTETRDSLLEALSGKGFEAFDGSETTNSDVDNWWLSAIGANDTKLTGKGIKVAILDTGVSIHPDLIGEGSYSESGDYIISGEDSRISMKINFAHDDSDEGKISAYDYYGHGTHCAGIVAGNGKLSDGKLRGVAPGAEIWNLRILNMTGEAEDEWIIDSFEYLADKDVDIVSCSFGYKEGFTVSAIDLAIEALVKKGKIVFASAGNEGPDFFSQNDPAACPYVISVGATDKKAVTSFSSVGPTWDGRTFPEITAPGYDILSLNSIVGEMYKTSKLLDRVYHQDGYFGYIMASGTSMSCPMTAGMTALVKQQYPEINPFAMRVALIKGAHPIDGYYPRSIEKAQGAGLINLTATLSYIESNKVESNPNKIATISYNKLPYDTKTLIQKPGDEQTYNYTFISGYAGTFTVETSGIDMFDVQLSKTSFVLEKPGIDFLSVKVKVPFDISEGAYQGLITIKEGSTIIDSIEVKITIANPVASVYFDTFHNEYDESFHSANAMHDFYQTIELLKEMNFSVSYQTSKTIGTGNQTKVINRCEFIHKGKLNYDILVLLNPVYQFSDEEIYSIKQFYNNGGSILITAGVQTYGAYQSINKLLAELSSGIAIGDEYISSPVDFFSPFNYNFLINNFTKTHPIFENVPEFVTGPGASLTVNEISSAEAIAWFRSNTIMACQNETDINRGKIVVLNDECVFSNQLRGETNGGTSSNEILTRNIFNYLRPESDLSIQVFDGRINSTQIPGDIAVSISNRTTKEGITGLDVASLNASLIYNSVVIQNYTLTENGNGFYSFSTGFNGNMSEPLPYTLKISYSVDSILHSKDHVFYYYNGSANVDYYNATIYDGPLTRKTNKAQIWLNSTVDGSSGFTMYGTFANPNMFSKIPSAIVTESCAWNAGNYMSFDPLSSLAYYVPAGNLYFYIYMGYDGYLQLSPTRLKVKVNNELPEIRDSSVIDGYTIDRYKEGLTGVQVFQKLNSISQYKIKVDDLEDKSMAKEQSHAHVSVIPVTVVENKIALLGGLQPKVHILKYNATEQSYIGDVVFNKTMTINNFGQEKQIEIYNNLDIMFLVYLSVRDLDGDDASLMYIVILGDKIENIMDFSVFISTSLSFIVVVLVLKIVNDTKKKKAARAAANPL